MTTVKVIHRDNKLADVGDPNIPVPPRDKTVHTVDAAMYPLDDCKYSISRGGELHREQLIPGAVPVRDEKALALLRHKAMAEQLRQEMSKPKQPKSDDKPSHSDEWIEYL